MITSQITIAPYTRQNRYELLRLIQSEHRLHIHLDWHSVDEWIADPAIPMFLAWINAELVGAMAASAPQGDTAWLRLIVFRRDVEPEKLLAALWPPLQERLINLDVELASVLILYPWLAPHLATLGFTFHEEIVTLRWQGASIPPPRRKDIHIRHVAWRDAKLAIPVDHAAFAPLWQLDLDSLQQAAHSAASFTLAELDNRIVGYQLSTLYHEGAHLARLATLPEVQGSGVGGALVGDMIQQYIRRNVAGITVNTQQSNAQSLRLYRRYGFDFTGLNMPVWAVRLGGG